MNVINMKNEEITYKNLIESHNYVLKQCEEIERLYNVEIILTHNMGMEYSIKMKDLYSDLVLLKYDRNTPGKTKNYLKGLIDASKLEIK